MPLTEEEISVAYAAATIDQPIIPLDASYEEMPAELLRRCCPGKSCGNTEVTLMKLAIIDDDSPTGASLLYGYSRHPGDPGDDAYYYGWRSALADLAAAANDPKYFPVDEAAWNAASDNQMKGLGLR